MTTGHPTDNTGICGDSADPPKSAKADFSYPQGVIRNHE